MRIQSLFSAQARGIFAVIVLVMFVYGMIMFPDAPINPGSYGYAGRLGKLYSEVEYQHFFIWSRAFLAVFVLAVVYTIIWWVRRKKEKVDRH